MAKELSYWARWVSGVERAMNGVEWLFYSAYRIIRWPIVGLWGLGRSALQRAGLVAPPEPAAAPPAHLTIDLRGRWYTGTSILGRINLFRRFHHWLLAWYTLNPERLTRWYGSDHKFSEVTFLGTMGRDTADDLFHRMTSFCWKFLPGYYPCYDQALRAKVLSLKALCQVHFEGDYDEADAIGLLRSAYAFWLDEYAFDVKLVGQGKDQENSRWYTVPKATRVQLTEHFQKMRLYSVMLNEFRFLTARFKLESEQRILSPGDVEVLRENFNVVSRYVEEFFAARDELVAYREAFKELYNGARSGYMEDLDNPLFSIRVDNIKEELQRRSKKATRAEVGKQSLDEFEAALNAHGVPAAGLHERYGWMYETHERSESHLLEDLREAAERRGQIQASGAEAIQKEQESDDYERTHEGFWGFCQDVFGLVRLRPKAPDGISPDEIREQVVDGFDEARADGAEEGAPVSGPADDVVTDVFVEGPPAQLPAEPPVSSEDADSTQQPAHTATSG